MFLINLGTKEIKKETDCAINVCSYEDAISYYYDYADSMCYCYNNDGELILERYIK